MASSNSPDWCQMHFFSPEGREEVLWVETIAANAFRVLNVPVWLYGVSVGTVVSGKTDGRNDHLTFGGVSRDSAGATVRIMLPPGVKGSQFYLSRVIPDSKAAGYAIGPATFFDPRVVAINLHSRKDWWPLFGSYLDQLVRQNLLEQWEVADPDQYPDTAHDAPPEGHSNHGPLVHRLPVSGQVGASVT